MHKQGQKSQECRRIQLIAPKCRWFIIIQCISGSSEGRVGSVHTPTMLNIKGNMSQNLFIFKCFFSSSASYTKMILCDCTMYLYSVLTYVSNYIAAGGIQTAKIKRETVPLSANTRLPVYILLWISCESVPLSANTRLPVCIFYLEPCDWRMGCRKRLLYCHAELEEKKHYCPLWI